MTAALVEVVAGEDVVEDDQTPEVFHRPPGEKRWQPDQAVGGYTLLLKFLHLGAVVRGGMAVAVEGKIDHHPPHIPLHVQTLQRQFADVAKEQFTGAPGTPPEGLIA